MCVCVRAYREEWVCVSVCAYMCVFVCVCMCEGVYEYGVGDVYGTCTHVHTYTCTHVPPYARDNNFRNVFIFSVTNQTLFAPPVSPISVTAHLWLWKFVATVIASSSVSMRKGIFLHPGDLSTFSSCLMVRSTW